MTRTSATCALALAAVDSSTSRAPYLFVLARQPAVSAVTSASMLIALAVAGPLALMAVAGTLAFTAWLTTSSARVRHRLWMVEQDRLLQRRRCRREARLADAGVSCDGLQEVTDLVDAIRIHAPAEYERLELEDLLDLYAELAFRHARCESSIASNPIASMVTRSLLTSARCQQLIERRIAYTERQQSCARQLEEELACITELVSLIAERALAPLSAPLPTKDDAIEALLAQLDAEEAAVEITDAACSVQFPINR